MPPLELKLSRQRDTRDQQHLPATKQVQTKHAPAADGVRTFATHLLRGNSQNSRKTHPSVEPKQLRELQGLSQELVAPAPLKVVTAQGTITTVVPGN